MKLAYRTRGNTSPQGKPRVYFTGHPADLEPYSKEIFPDILRTQDCAIYYDEQMDAPFDQEELLRTLEEMQLIVIPVTSRFLYRPNRARELELPFAVEHHIPILPLMQEQELQAGFNRECGDLQVLSKQDQSAGVIPYPEKLKRFLDSVLMGDSMAARVRDAFQAYIFLSYRKKDRKYTHELMRLIHQNEFCRDVAIWYDEFLTPGEDFTSNIQKAMDKSCLMTMAITPNMVNENNYVIEHEYPDARRANKPILPVEMAATDREALSEKFPGIPDAIPAGDTAALAGQLRANLPDTGTSPNSPEQDYLIGLAYLNGIDLEVDKKRAAELITSAAEAGLPEAMERLADMYQRGNGVPRSYRAAVQWQERLADWRLARFEEDGTRENALMWVLALCGLGKCQEEIRDLSAAAETYTRVTEASRELAGRYGGMGVLSCLRFSYERLGNISVLEEKPDEGERFYLQELDVIRQLSEADGYEASLEYQTAARYIPPQRNPADCYNDLGDVNKPQGKPDEARRYYQKSMEIFRQLGGKQGRLEIRRGLAAAYGKLADIDYFKIPLDEAMEHARKALEISRQLYEETGTAEAKRDLAAAYQMLGKINDCAGRVDESMDYALRALALFKQLYEDTGTIKSQEDLILAYRETGVSCKNADETDQYCRQGLELAEQLCQEVETARGYALLSTVLAHVCVNNRKLGRLRESEKYVLRALALDEQRCRDSMNIETQESLTLDTVLLAEVFLVEERLDEAKDVCLRWIEDSERQDSPISQYPVYQWYIARFHRDLADIFEKSGRPDEAEKYNLKALEVLSRIAEEIVAVHIALFGAYYSLSRVCQDRSKAKEYCTRGLELAGRLYEGAQILRYQEGLSAGHRHLAAILAEEGETRQAVEHYEKALRIAEDVLRQDEWNLVYEDEVAKNAFQIGLLAQWDAALQKDMLTQAHDIWTRLSERSPEVPGYARQRGMARAELDRLTARS